MRIALLVAVLVAVLTPAPPSRACGGLVQQDLGIAAQASQLSVLVVNAETTDFVLTLDVPGADGAFGVLVPVPAQPTIADEPVSADALAALEQYTRPTVRNDAADEDVGFGCSAPDSRAGGAENSLGGDVDVGDAVVVGSVTAQWLSGASGAAIVDWLAANDFVLPTGAQAIVDAYVAEGASFVAFKKTDAASEAERVGVKLTLDGDRRAYAMRMTTVGAKDEMAFTILVVAPDGVGPDVPYAGLTLDDLDAQKAISDYEGAVRDAVAAAGGKAFVVESVRSGDQLREGPATAAADLLPAGSTVTRMTSVVRSADLDADVTFTAETPDGMINVLDVGAAVGSTIGWAPPRFDPMLPALLAALALVVMMRWRRRSDGAPGFALASDP